MKVALLIASLLFVGCTPQWKTAAESTLKVTHNSVRTARLQSALLCKPVVIYCIEENQNPCPALDKCFAYRRKLFAILESTETAVKVGYEALEAGDVKGGKDVALSAIAIATDNAAQIIELINIIKKEFAL